MKTKLLVCSALALCALAFAQSYTAPQPVLPNLKQAKTEYNSFIWANSDAEVWLRVTGNDKAATLSEQWGPQAVSITSTREPVVTHTDSGAWVIRFK